MAAPENQPVQFADFHVHGSFKAYFTGYSVEEKKSPWEPVSIGIDRLLFRTTNRVLGSQSCFSQLLKGRIGLAVIPLYSTERAFPASFLLKLIDLFSKKISGRLFKAIRKNKVTYWQQLDDCWLHLQRAATDNVPGSEQVNFTRSLEDIKQGKMNIVLSMEGAHCFLDSDDDVATPAGMQKVIDRMMLYKKRDPDAAQPRVFILNLTHLTRGPFCNHGFGMKLIAHNEFVPRGKGLSAAGIQLIEAALLNDEKHFPFIIDIKHMSLKSRAEYYELRRKNFPAIPVIASHAGCTGISCEDIPNYIEEIRSPWLNHRKCNLVTYAENEPRGRIPGTKFNPWSINLYNEDIVEILSSDGIIGLSLDQRILGCGKIANEKMSKEETFSTVTPSRPLVLVDPWEKKPIEDAELHFRHFCNTIFHIVKVGSSLISPARDPWKHIVIGSDFDGLIDSVDFCCNAEQYTIIADYIVAKLPALAEEAGLMLPAEPAVIAADLLYNNAHSFLKKYYSRTAFL